MMASFFGLAASPLPGFAVLPLSPDLQEHTAMGLHRASV